MIKKPAIVLVANWESGVGYAWWLMESFWIMLAERYSPDHEVLLAYPAITTLNANLQEAPLRAVVQDFQDRSIKGLLFQCQFLRRHSARLIYLSDWGTWDWRYLLFRLCGVRRIVIHDHTPGQRIPPTGLKRRIKRVLNRIPGLAADGAIGATDYVKERLAQVSCFPARKCFAAPNGLPQYSNGERIESGPVRQLFEIPTGRRIMVMTGRANRYKNASFVLRCLARLRSEGVLDLHFLFIGDGPHLDEFRAESEALGVAEYCSFPGKRSDVPDILRACDFAIHPSHGEVGYSLSILEYMQAGLPVLVPDDPSVCGATVDGETGFVYRKEELDSGVDAIRRLAENPKLRAEMGQKAKQLASERFRLEDTHRALLDAFDVIDAR